MVLVTKPERGKGHGTRLLQRCIDNIEATGGAMGLDATEFGRPIYLPLGFRDVYPLSRWSAPAGIRDARCRSGRHRHQADPPAGSCDDRQLRPASAAGSSAARCWRICCSARRGVAHVAERGDGSSPATASAATDIVRRTSGRSWPRTQAIGLALLSRALAAAHGPAILDVPDQHASIRQWLQSQGASAPRSFMRMLRGPAPAVEDGSRIMALAGPELA